MLELCGEEPPYTHPHMMTDLPLTKEKFLCARDRISCSKRTRKATRVVNPTSCALMPTATNL